MVLQFVERSAAVKRLLMFAGAVGLLAMAGYTPARADAYVDAPSFGRIVYGLTGGTVVLPKDAWQGAYPDGSGPTTTGNDAGFGGGAILVGTVKQYVGDSMGTPGANFGFDYATALASVGGTETSVLNNASGMFDSGSLMPKDAIVSLKLGFVASYAKASAIGVYGSDGVTKPTSGDVVSLFAPGASAGTVGTATVDNPFAFIYESAGSSSIPAFDYYSDNPANNSGYAANKLYNHVLSYQITDASNPFYGYWFIGFEDTNFNTKGNPGYHRFDYNDSVIMMSFEAVPEPAFYQMAGLLSLGAFGLLRMRRRS